MLCNSPNWSLIALSFIMMLALAACENDSHVHPELTTGKELFDHHCAVCHNKEGIGLFLRGVPANIATEKNQTEIILHIKQGSQFSKLQMPVYRNMSDKEAQKIAFYLLRLKNEYLNNPENKDKLLLQRKR